MKKRREPEEKRKPKWRGEDPSDSPRSGEMDRQGPMEGGSHGSPVFRIVCGAGVYESSRHGLCPIILTPRWIGAAF